MIFIPVITGVRGEDVSCGIGARDIRPGYAAIGAYLPLHSCFTRGSNRGGYTYRVATNRVTLGIEQNLRATTGLQFTEYRDAIRLAAQIVTSGQFRPIANPDVKDVATDKVCSPEGNAVGI